MTGDDRDGAMEAFHIELLATLTGADFRLGKGYGLGRALADVTRSPDHWLSELAPGRVATLAAWLRDLSTVLPWRSLISGEKRATQMLETSDYVAAGENLLQSTARLAKPVIKHHLPVLLGAVALFVAGIVLMLVADDPAGIVSGAGVILTALGIGWKGLGTTVGRTIAKVETPLWEAALDVSIRNRVTPQRLLDNVPPRPRGPDEPSLVAAARGAAPEHA